MDLAYLIAHWQHVRAALLQTIAKFRDNELDYRPFKASRTVRAMMLHIAHEEAIEYTYGISQEINELLPEYGASAHPTLDSIAATLQSVHERTRAHLAALDDHGLGQAITTPWGVTSPRIELIGTRDRA